MQVLVGMIGIGADEDDYPIDSCGCRLLDVPGGFLKKIASLTVRTSEFYAWLTKERVLLRCAIDC
jgi:hypothetical protein